MSKNFISFNLKAKKKCDADGMLLHCENIKARQKSDNIQYPENTKLNVSSPDLHKRYLEITNRIENIKGKKIQKNANHYLEGCLSFSYEKYKENPQKFRQEAPALIKKYMNDIAEKYHFEPVGYSLHFDEGHKNENGEEELNVHAHISFVNYDFKTNKARFREIQKKFVSGRKYPNEHFVAMQDMAEKCFKCLGFQRGKTKQLTQKQHLEKVAFVEKKLEQKDKKIEQLELKLLNLKKVGKSTVEQVVDVREKLEVEESKLNKVKLLQEKITNNLTRIIAFASRLSSDFLKLIDLKKKKSFYEYNEKIESLNCDFENIKKDIIINTDFTPFDQMVDNAIALLPEDTKEEQQIKSDMDKSIKRKKLKREPIK